MNENKPQYGQLRYGIRDLLWAMVAAGLALGWIMQWRISAAREKRVFDRQAEAIRAEIQLTKTKSTNEKVLNEIRDQRERFPIEKGVLKDPEDTPKPSPLSQLQLAWRDDLSKRDAFKGLTEQIFETERIVVREITGQAAFERIDGTLTASERRTLILLGELNQLRKQPKLKEVHNPGTFGNGFSAYLTPEGELLFFWIIPEG
jgi:hypothetical protein